MNTKINTQINELESSNSRLTGFLRGAVVCTLMAGAVLVGSGMHREGALVTEANAAAITPDASSAGYFPAQFPAPRGEPAPHIEAF